MRRLWVLLLVTACTFPVTKPVPAGFQLPPIPDSLETELGPVMVVQDTALKNEKGDRLMGGFAPAIRTVYIDRKIVETNRIVAWQVLEHERCHVTMWDTGLRQLFNSEGGEKVADAICDAMSRERVKEMLRDARKP